MVILGQGCYNELESGKPEWLTVILWIVVLLLRAAFYLLAFCSERNAKQDDLPYTEAELILIREFHSILER
jgi:hypothetical protein